MHPAQCTHDLGSALTKHCQRVASFARQRAPADPQLLFATLLVTSTNAGAQPGWAGAPRGSSDDAVRAWYDVMKKQYESECAAAAQSEDCAELRSLCRGACAGRKQVPVAQVPKMLGDFAAQFAGSGRLAALDWNGLVQALLPQSASATLVDAEDVVSLFMRVYCDLAVSPTWFADRAGACVVVHQTAFATSPDVQLRYRISHPAVVAAEEFAAGRTVREVVLRLDDEDVIPGASVAPVVRKWRAALELYGIPEATLQRGCLHLQRLLKGEMAPAAAGGGGGAPANEGAKSTNVVDATSSLLAASGKPAAAATASPANDVAQKADVGLLYVDPEKAMRNVDLNSADQLTLQEFKDKMDEKFKENAVRPGDAGYVYDKVVEFKPSAKSEWDDD